MPHRNGGPKPCIDCGALIGGAKWYRGHKTCAPCGTKRAAQAAIDMATKSGAAWARWQRSNADGAHGPRHDTER